MPPGWLPEIRRPVDSGRSETRWVGPLIATHNLKRRAGGQQVVWYGFGLTVESGGSGGRRTARACDRVLSWPR